MWDTWGMRRSMEFGKQRSLSDKRGKGTAAYKKLKAKPAHWNTHREEANWVAVNSQNQT